MQKKRRLCDKIAPIEGRNNDWLGYIEKTYEEINELARNFVKLSPGFDTSVLYMSGIRFIAARAKLA